MHYQKVLKMPESIPYLSVGFDVGADFTWMSIMLPNGILIGKSSRKRMLMYGKEASNRKQEIDRQHYTIPNQRPKDKHCGKI